MAFCYSNATLSDRTVAAMQEHFRSRGDQHEDFGRRQRVGAASSSGGSGGGGDDADISDESDPEAVALTMSRLERELDAAVQAEDYVAAAGLRDRLRRLQSDNEAAVIAANALFYRAFGSADLRLMRRVWARGEHLQCIHPGANIISGYDMVLNSWELIFDGMNRQLSITLEDVACHVRGSMAMVTCVEVIKSAGSAGRVVATNVFEKVGSQWLMCCHQGSPAPPSGRKMGL
ncbi:unnamed protein product [Closterium sp. Yama58-4]|nr:unnamed protein product [Closterium sp. Yama58-4]